MDFLEADYFVVAGAGHCSVVAEVVHCFVGMEEIRCFVVAAVYCLVGMEEAHCFRTGVLEAAARFVRMGSRVLAEAAGR